MKDLTTIDLELCLNSHIIEMDIIDIIQRKNNGEIPIRKEKVTQINF